METLASNHNARGLDGYCVIRGGSHHGTRARLKVSSAPVSALPPPHALARTSALGLVLEFVAIVAGFVALSVAAGDPSNACRWCSTNVFDTAVRDLVVMRDPRLAATVSHVCSMLLAPVLALGAVVAAGIRSRVRSHAAQDAVIVLNAVLLTVAFTDFAKKVASRQRPAFHFGVGATTEAANVPVERFLSFFSGDTAIAFALIAASATVLRLRGHDVASRVATAGGVVAMAAGVLRVAADMHWASDVLTGAAVGTLVGVALPTVVHGRKITSVAAQESSGG